MLNDAEPCIFKKNIFEIFECTLDILIVFAFCVVLKNNIEKVFFFSNMILFLLESLSKINFNQLFTISFNRMLNLFFLIVLVNAAILKRWEERITFLVI